MKKNWLKLKENICPMCDNGMQRSEQADYECLGCGFYCRYSKAQVVIQNIEAKEYDKKVDKLYLNK